MSATAAGERVPADGCFSASSWRRFWTADAPRLHIVPSPYRRLIRPVVEYVNRLKDERPDRLIAVIIPELVETHWYEYLLHNHLATWLKADLMLQEEQRIVVINLPWYLS